jgi:hypothetical protein
VTHWTAQANALHFEAIATVYLQSPSARLPQPLLEQYAKNKPDLGKNGHCAAAFDSRTDGLKMAMSCSIYVRLSAQGERLAVSLCNERAKLLKVKAPCALIVED